MVCTPQISPLRPKLLTQPTPHTDHLVLKGSNGSIYAIGDCTASNYAPTAQVASQQGAYLARVFKQMAKKDTTAAEVNALKASGAQVEEKNQAEGGVNLKDDLERLEKQVERAGKIRPFRYSHQGSLA